MRNRIVAIIDRRADQIGLECIGGICEDIKEVDRPLLVFPDGQTHFLTDDQLKDLANGSCKRILASVDRFIYADTDSIKKEDKNDKRTKRQKD